tara:strand:+ start:235 stop:432 length:198 start_codon:yes stop_codon:yes gene_type:complete
MNHGENSQRDKKGERPFVLRPKRENEISKLVIDRKPSKLALWLSRGKTIWVIYPVEDTGKYKKKK